LRRDVPAGRLLNLVANKAADAKDGNGLCARRVPGLPVSIEEAAESAVSALLKGFSSVEEAH
jgi:hypothetical protein